MQRRASCSWLVVGALVWGGVGCSSAEPKPSSYVTCSACKTKTDSDMDKCRACEAPLVIYGKKK